MEKKIGNLFKGDKGIWTVFLFLCLISIVEVFSASSTLTYKTHNYLSPLIYHCGMIFLGVVVAIVILNIPCRNRVIQLPGFTFQPSEIAKGTMVLTAAQILSAMQRDDDSGADPMAMKYVLFLVVPATMLIGLENLSTAILLFGVIFVMMFLARVPLKQMGKLTGVLVLLAGMFLGLVFWMANLDKEGQEMEQAQLNGQTEQVVQVDKKDKSAWEKLTHRFWTWKNRIAGKDDKDVPAEEYKVTDKNFQVTHANLAWES